MDAAPSQASALGSHPITQCPSLPHTPYVVCGRLIVVALDYGPKGIRSNAVCPGWVQTPMSDLEMDELASQIGTNRQGAFAKVVEQVPMRRVAKPEEIAGACVYLASSESSFMTGAVLVVDGGSAVVDVGTMAFRA